jgi:hypothetical protein
MKIISSIFLTLMAVLFFPQSSLAAGILDIVTNNPALGSLKECQGDCDNDSECQAGLKCFNRDKKQPVPGCSGDKDSYAGTDFCYKPIPVAVPKPVPKPVPVPVPTKATVPTKPLQFKGNNGAAGLLDTCEGDCDKDSECKAGLKCFQRSALQSVPGCTGDKPSWEGFDFCVKTTFPLKFISKDNGPFPFNACEGDCDRDSDCKPGLKCFHREATKVVPVPGCTGDKPEWAGEDFCYKP